MECRAIVVDGKTDQRSAVKKCRLQICTSGIEKHCDKFRGARVCLNITLI